MSGIRITLPAGTKIEDGKVKPKTNTYRAKQKRAQAQRDQGLWLRKAKKP